MSVTKKKAKVTRSPASKPDSMAGRRPKRSGASGSGDVLTLSEAAAYLRVSEEEVVGLVGPSGLPGRRIGDEWRFLKSALQDWLATPPMPSSKESLMSLAGAWKHDPYAEELREHIKKQRTENVE